MYAAHDRIFAEELAVSLLGDALELRAVLRLPGGIAVGLLHIGTGELISSLHGVADVRQVRRDVGALRAYHHDLVVLALYACHVA